MKKEILRFLFAAIMILILLPVTSYAEPEPEFRFDLCNGEAVLTSKPVDPTWGNYVFAGWYDAEIGGFHYTDITEPGTYYAHWWTDSTMTTLVLTEGIIVNADGIYIGALVMTDFPQYGLSFKEAQNNEPATLTMTNAIIEAGDGVSTNREAYQKDIYAGLYSSIKLNINVNGDNKVRITRKDDSSNAYAIYVYSTANNPNLTVSGTGTLTGDAQSAEGANVFGVFVYKQLVNSATLIGKSGKAANTAHGIAFYGLDNTAGELIGYGGTAGENASGINNNTKTTPINISGGKVVGYGGVADSYFYGLWAYADINISGNGLLEVHGGKNATTQEKTPALFLDETQSKIITISDNGKIVANGTIKNVGSYGGTYFVSGAQQDTVDTTTGTILTQNETCNIIVSALGQYKITVDDAITNGTVTTKASGGKAFAGDTVTLEVTPSDGFVLKADTLKAIYNDGENKSLILTQDVTDETKYTFTMPEYAVEITAEFEKKTRDFKITATSDKSAYIEGEQIKITGTLKEGTTPVDNEAVTVDVTDTKKYNPITSGDGSFCVDISGVLAGTYEIKVSYEKDGNTYESKLTVAVKEQTKHSISVTNDGNGTAVAKDINDNAISVAEESDKIILMAEASDGYLFKKWQVISPSGLTITDNGFTMPKEDVSVKAIFEAKPSDIKVTASTEKSTYSVGEGIVVKGTVRDGNDPVANVKVDFSANGELISLTTDGEGCCYADFKSLPAGSYVICVSYEKDGRKYEDKAEVTVKEPNVIHIVKFDLNNGKTNVPEPQKIDSGKKASEPEAPTCEGFIFAGWYSDAELTVKFDFDTPITADTTLFAKWTADRYAENAAAAAEVVKKINAIGNVEFTEDCKNKIEAARDAYDELNDDQQEMISAEQYKVLTDAEKAYSKLKKNAEKRAAEIALDEKLNVTTGKSIKVEWGTVPGASGYDVYMAYCGKSRLTVVKTVKSSKVTSTTVNKLNKKAIDQAKHIKCKVVAYKVKNGKKVTICESIVLHAVGKLNKSVTDAKSIKLSKSSYKLKVGGSATIKATTVKKNKKLPILPKSHTCEFRYASADDSIVTVSENGKITARGKGSCYIYVYAVNGCCKKVKVTVK